MKYKNDLDMWHKFAEFADHLRFVAEDQERRLFEKCKSYEYDDEAYEEYCNQEKIVRQGDFSARRECWKCPYYQIRERLKGTYGN